MVGVPHLSGKEKIYSALLVLACEPGKIEKRLETAYRLVLSGIDPQLDLPPQYVRDFSRIRDELHKAYLVPQHADAAREIEHRQWATNIATDIVALYDKIARLK